MIRIILIHHGIKDITNDDRLYVVEEHIEPHRDNGDGKTISYEEDCFVFQDVSDGDGGNGETRVRENHSPPTQVEVDSPLVDDLVDC